MNKKIYGKQVGSNKFKTISSNYYNELVFKFIL